MHERDRGETLLNQIRGSKPPRIGVSLLGVPIYRELGAMVAEILTKSGFEAVLSESGRRTSLDCDVLLLIGDGVYFSDLARRLQDLERRPVTILWQLEPLPPPEITHHSDARAESVIAKSGRLLSTLLVFPRPLRRVIGSLALMTARFGAMKVVSPILMSSLEAVAGIELRTKWADLDLLSCMLLIRASTWYRRKYSNSWLDFVFASTVSQQRFLAQSSVPATFVPPGYHRGMGHDSGQHRDIDVVFIGNSRHRRRGTELKRIVAELKARGITVMTIGTGCYGEERTRLLNRARISLNLVNFPWDIPAVRFLLSMACGAMVVSETIDESAPFEPGKHYVAANIADIPDVVSHYLANDAERNHIIKTAREFIVGECTLERAVGEFTQAYYQSTRPMG